MTNTGNTDNSIPTCACCLAEPGPHYIEILVRLSCMDLDDSPLSYVVPGQFCEACAIKNTPSYDDLMTLAHHVVEKASANPATLYQVQAVRRVGDAVRRQKEVDFAQNSTVPAIRH